MPVIRGQGVVLAFELLCQSIHGSRTQGSKCMRASIIIVISLWVLLLVPGRKTKAKARVSIGPGRSNHKIPRPKDARLRSARRNRAAADQNTHDVCAGLACLLMLNAPHSNGAGGAEGFGIGLGDSPSNQGSVVRSAGRPRRLGWEMACAVWPRRVRSIGRSRSDRFRGWASTNTHEG